MTLSHTVDSDFHSEHILLVCQLIRGLTTFPLNDIFFTESPNAFLKGIQGFH